MMDKNILILSGGLDSVVLLYYLLNKKENIFCLIFDYGQKAKKEIESAKNICKELDVEHYVYDVSNMLDILKSSSLIDEKNSKVKIPADTVIPSRNTIFIELATAFAILNNYKKVYYGAIKSSSTDYKDITPQFLKQINELNKVNNNKYIPIEAPFINKEKSEVIKISLELNVPLEKTWSCYLNGDEPCGECFSCKSRIEAIEKVKKELGDV